ncbi:MAG: hypothetical protein K9M57_09395, partial [Phycisphaerae bacterium]|nr:hypothetical protein [Phycisphaerae bacterium]
LTQIEEAADKRVPEPGAARQKVFDQLLAVTVDTLYQETLRAVFGSADEVFDLPSTKGKNTEVRVFMSRDATLAPKADKAGDKASG